MKTINKYVDEISGREFKTVEEAIKSEKKNGGIKRLFGFWKERPKSKGCDFENGRWCYQRTDHEYLRLLDAFVKAINEYEPWIAKQYEENGGFKREFAGPSYMIGRYLDDGNSELNKQYHIISNICPKCYREWGQAYHAIHCKHDAEPREDA